MIYKQIELFAIEKRYKVQWTTILRHVRTYLPSVMVYRNNSHFDFFYYEKESSTFYICQNDDMSRFN